MCTLVLKYILVRKGVIFLSRLEEHDLDYGTKFETYAIQRIRGKIIDELRKIQIKPRVMVKTKINRFILMYLYRNQWVRRRSILLEKQ